MQPIISSDNRSQNEAWSKPEVKVIPIIEETLGLGVDPEKIIHFFEGS